jgi:hypothetical protein
MPNRQLDAIANPRDRGLDPAHSKSSRMGNFLAIAAGWLDVGAIILYPGQLAAFMICAAFLGPLVSRHPLDGSTKTRLAA